MSSLESVHQAACEVFVCVTPTSSMCQLNLRVSRSGHQQDLTGLPWSFKSQGVTTCGRVSSSLGIRLYGGVSLSQQAHDIGAGMVGDDGRRRTDVAEMLAYSHHCLGSHSSSSMLAKHTLTASFERASKVSDRLLHQRLCL